jgi:hypothetical protein
MREGHIEFVRKSSKFVRGGKKLLVRQFERTTVMKAENKTGRKPCFKSHPQKVLKKL